MTVFEAVILKRQTSPLDSAYRDSMFLNLSLFWFGVVSLDFGGYFFFFNGEFSMDNNRKILVLEIFNLQV